MRLFKRLSNTIEGTPTLWWWTLVVMLVPAVALMITETPPMVAKIGGLLMAGCFYALWLSVGRNLPKAVLWLLPFMIFNGWEIVLLGLYGRNVIAVDMFLNLLTTNSDEVTELLSNLWVSVGLVIILYVPVLVAAITLLIRKQKGVRVKAGRWAVSIGALGFVMTIPYAAQGFYRYQRDLYPANVCYNLGKAFVEYNRAANRNKNAAGFTFNASTDRPDTLPETYILVIGETARADRWQLTGYERQTNSLLSQVEGLVSFDKALSQSNTTHKSVPMLMTHLTSKNYGDSIDKVKGIMTAFAEAGYSTTFISNQRRNHSYIDHLGEEAQNAIFIRDSHPAGLPSGDLALISYVDSVLKKDNKAKRLVVVHTYGSHFNYRDRYNNPVFTPDTYPAATAASRDALNNAYDNTIVLTDSLIAGLIEIADRQQGLAGVMYTSDHGEDIFDDERNLFLHASPSPSFYQVYVPFVVWTSSGHRSQYPDFTTMLNNNRGEVIASSAAFFPLALDMAGITTAYSPIGWSPARPLQPQDDLYYLTDLNESVPLVNAGFQSQDIERLRHLLKTRGR